MYGIHQATLSLTAEVHELRARKKERKNEWNMTTNDNHQLPSKCHRLLVMLD